MDLRLRRDGHQWAQCHCLNGPEDNDMTDLFTPIRQAVTLRVPAEHRVPIAIVGAGEIVDLAHLPAYAAHGLEIAGIFDRDSARASAVAACERARSGKPWRRRAWARK